MISMSLSQFDESILSDGWMRQHFWDSSIDLSSDEMLVHPLETPVELSAKNKQRPLPSLSLWHRH